MDELEHDYNVLNLQPGASLEEVKQAYRTLALQWHPIAIPRTTPVKSRPPKSSRKLIKPIIG
ncbi:MAG: J domain-containing protein [Oscillatoriales cyanobacterium RM2_1_1]|nr:J domain-containing protein [Oscillatoriales cyanobacterium RM2_1_1]